MGGSSAACMGEAFSARLIYRTFHFHSQLWIAMTAAASQPYESHPIADIWPLLSDEELQELAEDIKQRGFLNPEAF